MARNFNAFRDRGGKLDKAALRLAAVWRLVRANRITTKDRAVALLEERGFRHARQTVEQWLTNSALKSCALARA